MTPVATAPSMDGTVKTLLESQSWPNTRVCRCRPTPFCCRQVTLHNNQISTMLLRLCVLASSPVNQLLNATDAHLVLVSTVAALPAVSVQAGLVNPEWCRCQLAV